MFHFHWQTLALLTRESGLVAPIAQQLIGVAGAGQVGQGAEV